MSCLQVLRKIVAKHEPNAVRGVVRIDFRNSFPSSYFARRSNKIQRGVIITLSELTTANNHFAWAVCIQKTDGMVEAKIIDGLEYLFLTEKGRMNTKKHG